MWGKNWVANSLRAAKDHIEPLDEARASAAFDALHPVRYDLREPGPSDPPGQFGFIVDDMANEPALQSIVRDSEGYVPDQIIPILVAKIRQLEARLAQLEPDKPPDPPQRGSVRTAAPIPPRRGR